MFKEGCHNLRMFKLFFIFSCQSNRKENFFTQCCIISYNIIFLIRRQIVVPFLVLSHNIFTLRTAIGYGGLLKEHNTNWNGRNNSFMQVFLFARYISSWKLQEFCYSSTISYETQQECQSAVLCIKCDTNEMIMLASASSF